MSEDAPSYHDLYITCEDIPRTSIFNLPYGLEVHCSRVTGWQLWDLNANIPHGLLIAGEYDNRGLRLDVAGHVITDSLTRRRGR